MKKILPVLVLIGFLTALAVPMVVLALEAPRECCTLRRAITLDGVPCGADSIAAPNAVAAAACGPVERWCGVTSAPKWGMFCLLNTLYSVTDWIFVLLVALAVIFVVIGGFTLITAAGDATKVGTGRNYVLYAVIGLVVAVLARIIPSIVRMVVGM